ncbi:TPA: DEAD/DEAH box helicase [Streptococcus suis]
MEIIKGSSKNPVVDELLVDFFAKNHPEMDATLYTGYPIIGTTHGPYPIDATLISSEYGVVIFDLISGTESSDIIGFEERQDEIFNIVDGYLKSYKELTNRRQLKVPLTIVSYAPEVHSKIEDDEYLIFNNETLHTFFKKPDNYIDDKNFSTEDFNQVKSVIQNIKNIRESISERKITTPNSRGAKIEEVKKHIATLDPQQSKAVVESVEGVQRIRGLAGSGKTIVLAMKAAYLHAKHKDWKIVVTFNTRSLKEQFKELITRFYVSQTQTLPNWENLKILNAWGRPVSGDDDGLYHQFVKYQDDAEYYDFAQAKRKFGFEPFEKVCQEAIQKMNQSVPLYDVILIDEAQDFSKYFFQICYHLVRDKKRIVYAYDELQSLSGKSLPSPEELFGNKTGTDTPRVTLERNDDSEDIVLEKCYRNPRPILVTAHALGFGVYRKTDERSNTGLIQMFEDSELWNEVGYENTLTRDHRIELGQEVRLTRTDKTSPKFLEEHSDFDDLILFKKFDDKDAQSEWIAQEIIKNLKEDDLTAKDIIVINPDPIKTKNEVAKVRAILFEQGYISHIAGETNANVFYVDDISITFTGIYRAKGNEASMVYVMNAQDCYDSFNELQTVRNRLFTAMTRSKGWVRVTGVGEKMDLLSKEYNLVRENNFDLHFYYPNKEELALIQTINRDKTAAEKRTIDDANKGILKILESIKSGQLTGFDIDLSADDRELLLQHIKKD